VGEDRVLVRGDMLIDELNEILELYLHSEDIDTIGGLALNELGHVPEVGERLKLGDLTMVVEAMDGHGVSAVSMAVAPAQMQRLKEWIT
jgi:putative hemolysin